MVSLKKTPSHRRVALAVLIAFFGASAHAAERESLTLRAIFDSVLDANPTIRASRLEAQASKEDVSSVERRRWPTISTTLESYSGNERSYPTRALQVDQPVWDAGGISSQISEAKAASEVARYKYLLQEHELFLQVVSAWQGLLGARERIAVSNDALVRLRGFQSQMRRRVEAEASPRIELDLADSRILQTEVELALANASLQVAVAKLEQLTGRVNLMRRIGEVAPAPSLVRTRPFGEDLSRADWLAVAGEAPSVNKARLEVEQIKNRLSAKEAEGWPQVYARAYKPIGQIPYSSSDTSTTYFMGVRYTPGAGFATAAEARAIGTRLGGAEQTADAALREMVQTLQSDQLEFFSARSRVDALEKSVNGSTLVLESYRRQFDAGKKTWQDLLNAVRELAQNQYSLADARAAMAGAMYRLKIRMGREID